MGRLSSLFARTRQPPASPSQPPSAGAEQPLAQSPQHRPMSPSTAGVQHAPVAPLAMPTPGQLRRERRALLRVREERIRDLGGLMFEMYRRDQFRQDLVVAQCEELTGLDSRLRELDSLLAAANTGGRRAGTTARCLCGAPVIWGSHFCANCGRAVGEAPVVACAQCGHPLPAEARFCAACGSAVEPVDGGRAEAPPEPGAAEAVVDRAHPARDRSDTGLQDDLVGATATEGEAVAAGASEEREQPDPWER